MELRIARLTDLPALTPVFVAVFNAEPWSETWTRETATSFLADLLKTPGSHALVAWEDGGCFGAVFGQDTTRDRGLTHEVRERFVLPGVQRRGVGRALVERHLLEAEARGVTGTFLLTARESPAEAFWARPSFRQARRQVVLVRPRRPRPCYTPGCYALVAQ